MRQFFAILLVGFAVGVGAAEMPLDGKTILTDMTCTNGVQVNHCYLLGSEQDQAHAWVVVVDDQERPIAMIEVDLATGEKKTVWEVDWEEI